MHAATFGGNPIAARAGIATIEMIEDENLLENARQIGEVFRQRLTALQDECDLIREVRVLGMMIGIELSIDGAPVVQGLPGPQAADQLHAQHRASLAAGHEPDASSKPHDGCDILAEVLKEQAG